MISWLRERADAVEKARRVPPETISAFVEAGFFRILQPRHWGGWEMNPEVFWRVLMELGRGCCSSAWVMMILGVHQWEFGLMDPRAGDDIWGQDSSVRIASSYPPVGEAKQVDGGYLLSGHWPTSSGTDHADWAFISAFLKSDDGALLDRLAFLVSAKDYEIVDDWHVMGLCGTGSKSLRLKSAFVPTHRAHSMVDYSKSNRGAMYHYPFAQIFYGSVSSVICGFGQGAIDLYVEQMSSRKTTGTNIAAAQSPYVRDRLGRAVVKVNSAKARLFNIMAETTPRVEKHELIELDDRVRHIAEIAHTGRDVEEAVLLLFKATGARGIFSNQPLQRVVRDTLCGANHLTQNADDTLGLLGSHMLGGGLPPLVFGLREQPRT
jgi:3-hydroxy-9,10-secoandrosta-1,3,5(10)-triene-9,17-dione monooxygenase